MGKMFLRAMFLILFCAAPLCAQTTGFDPKKFLGAGALAILAIAVFYWLWDRLENQRGILLVILVLAGLAVVRYWPGILHWMWGSAITLPVK